ncbi:MAG: late competence development ComFB family protein [Burkholderiales bacterium]|nr:late competence development ComFB family protein [Burkholderiales bacterium]MDE2565222.1 late competence development ComFB family protein [Burkholderiales bacterium]
MPPTLPAPLPAPLPAAAGVDFSSVRNHNERAVYDAVQRQAGRFPGLAHSAELLADVACVALNRLAPRYIRHEVDFVFYLSERERSESEHQLLDAVEYAFGFVQARTAMRARG